MWALALLVFCIEGILAQFSAASKLSNRDGDFYITLSSSRITDFHEEECLDGNLLTFCHSDLQFYPYMDISFNGKSVNVSGLKLYNRQDCCGYRSEKFYIFAKDSPFEYHWTVDTNIDVVNLAFNNINKEASWRVQHNPTGGLVPETSYQFTWNNVVAKYLRIVMMRPDIDALNLAEIEVWSAENDYGETVITDIIFWATDRHTDIKPAGYHAVQCDESCTGRPFINADLNKGTSGKHIYMFYKKESLKTVDTFISALAVVTGDGWGPSSSNYGYTPPCPSAPHGDTMQVINQDLNQGAGGKYIFVCVQRTRFDGVPAGDTMPMLTDLILSEGVGNTALNGYEYISTDLNQNAGGAAIWLKWKFGRTPIRPNCEPSANPLNCKYN